MNPFDKLKELGFSDEELKNFFKKQESYSKKVNQIKKFKYSFGITSYTPAYTPSTLANRVSAYKDKNDYEKHMLKEGHKVYKLKQNFDLLGNIEKEQNEELKSLEEGVPSEIKETVQEFLKALNNFASAFDSPSFF